MATEQQTQDWHDYLAGLRERLVREQAGDLTQNPGITDAIIQRLEDQMHTWLGQQETQPASPDAGFAQLVGIGDESAPDLGATRVPQRVAEYDDSVSSERIYAVGDLYYIFQHEKVGVFRVIQKLKELFEAGTLRLSSGPGAFRLYQFDKKGVLRYTRRDRLAAYRRVLGYGQGPTPTGAQPNTEFHPLLIHFINEVTQFFRDKRVSDVIRDRPHDPSFGSIATVRRAGLDLRNNLRWASYGHVNVLRVEVMQLLEEAFRILNADDVRRQFGADNAWDVIEEVLTRYFHERLASSTRQRMAVSGRNILRWLAHPYILQTTRAQFEALLTDIAEDSEEWITSAQTLGLAERRVSTRVLPWDRQQRVSANGA